MKKTENESSLAEAEKKAKKANLDYLKAKRKSILADIERDIIREEQQ